MMRMLAFTSVTVASACDAGWHSASWTYYESYPACCPESPNYDPSAPTEECDVYSGCKYLGDFAYISHKSFDWVRSHNIIAFFSSHGDNREYGGKSMRVSAKGESFEVTVADTCGDVTDCDGCCTRVAEPTGYLVDMEYFTVKRHFLGEPRSVVGGEICWQLVSSACDAGWQSASWTYYYSYPACCPDSPNYDPRAPTEECDDYSGCKWMGDFAYIGHKSFGWVRSHNIISFFSSRGDNREYGGKSMRVSAKGVSFEVTVADTCGDDDCDGCCTRNAGPTGFLVDMEYFTVKNNFRGEPSSVVGGDICWQLIP